LGVSESRISQILSAVVKKLRGTLQVEPNGGGMIRRVTS
jgi:hypothetical protein